MFLAVSFANPRTEFQYKNQTVNVRNEIIILPHNQAIVLLSFYVSLSVSRVLLGIEPGQSKI